MSVTEPKSSKRDAILAATRRRYVTVPFPEFGFSVRLRSLTEKERSVYEMVLKTANNMAEVKTCLEDARRRLIVLMAVEDESDSPLFTELDVIGLEDTDSLITGRLFDWGYEHAGFGKGDIEAMVKNSASTGGDGSASDSQKRPVESQTETISSTS